MSRTELVVVNYTTFSFPRPHRTAPTPRYVIGQTDTYLATCLKRFKKDTMLSVSYQIYLQYVNSLTQIPKAVAMMIGLGRGLAYRSAIPSLAPSSLAGFYSHRVIRSIEDNCMLTCANLVKNCAVVGHYKPAVILFIEPTLSLRGETDVAAFKAEILKQTKPFNARLFQHERITDPNFIVVVPPGSLPRTTVRFTLCLMYLSC